jgi:hypothetical protein
MGKGMTVKEELLQEINAATDRLRIEVLNFFHGLKGGHNRGATEGLVCD